jgi:hypothetical protein
LTAAQLPRIFARLFGDAHSLQQLHRYFFRLRLRPSTHPDGCKRDIVDHRQMGEEIELLKDHAGLHADAFDVAHIVGQFDAIDDDLSTLMLFQAIDGADKISRST